MRRTILLSLFALLAASAADVACAQHRGGMRPGFARGGYRLSHARAVSPYGYGYGYLPYDYDSDYSYTPQPVLFSPQPILVVQPPAPPAVQPVANPVITEYKWPVAGAVSSASSTSDPGTQPFAIVLKNGSTLSAVMVFASDDGLHYVDPDERHLRIAISEIDREATLRINRARNLNLHLPAAQ